MHVHTNDIFEQFKMHIWNQH